MTSSFTDGVFFVIKVPDIGRADPQAQEGAKPRSGNVGGDRGSDQLYNVNLDVDKIKTRRKSSVPESRYELKFCRP